jgi:hypothetical protein
MIFYSVKHIRLTSYRSQPCDRRPLAYDVVKTRPTRDTQNKKSEELPDKFFELTAEDLRSVLNTLQQQR